MHSLTSLFIGHPPMAHLIIMCLVFSIVTSTNVAMNSMVHGGVATRSKSMFFNFCVWSKPCPWCLTCVFVVGGGITSVPLLGGIKVVSGA